MTLTNVLRNTVRFIRCALFGCVLSFPHVASAQTAANSKGPVTVMLYAEDSNAPYAFFDGVSADGIYVRILREAFERMPGYELELTSVPFRRGMELLKDGKITGFFPPYKRADRDWVERYSVPILSETVVVLCRNDYAQHHDLDVFPDDFMGARFANNAGYRMAGAAFFDMVEAGAITLEEANTTASNLRLLVAGRVDCYINERMAILEGLRELAIEHEVARSFDEVAIIGREFGYVAFGPDPDGQWSWRDQFADRLNQVLTDMSDNGVIDQLVVSYFFY